MRIGVLTGGGDVPGLNSCIKAIVNSAEENGWQVFGFRRGWLCASLPASFGGGNQYTEQIPEVPDIDAMRNELEFIQFELEPGDCTVHHGLTVHGSPGNQSPVTRRRAHTSRWTGDDVTYNPRPNLQRMLRDPGIAPGARLDSDLFPLVWRRGNP